MPGVQKEAAEVGGLHFFGCFNFLLILEGELVDGLDHELVRWQPHPWFTKEPI